MSQNTSREVAPPPLGPDWRRISARWSADVVIPNGSALTLSSTDGSGRLALMPGAAARRAWRTDPDWVSFRLRTAYPDATVARALPRAPYLLVVRVFAEPADRDNFRRWLDDEHCRRQVSLAGVNWYLGYEQDVPDHSFLNVWSIDEPSIVDSDAWVKARDTPWWACLSHVPSGADRGVYRRVE